MTGLDLERHKIIEIATVITNTQLDVLARGPAFVIKANAEDMQDLDPWVNTHLGATGLLDAALNSNVSLEMAMRETLKFVQSYCKAGHSPLCGNSIGTDRAFLRQYMPELESFLHYRNIDVSSVKLLAQAWKPNLAPFKKNAQHRALDDILESIEELRYYRTHLFH